MPDRLPCPMCKNPIAIAAADPRGKVHCDLCLHEFLLRGQRLTPWIDDLPTPTYVDPYPASAISQQAAPPPSRNRDRRPRDVGPRIAKTSSNKALWISLGVIGVILGGSFLMSTTTTRHKVPQFQFAPVKGVPDFQRIDLDPINDVIDLTPVDEAEIRRGSQEMLARLGPALLVRDRFTAMSLIDSARIFDEFQDTVGVRPGARIELIRDIASSIGDSITQHGDKLGFAKFEIVDVKKIGVNDGEVTTRHHFDGGDVNRIRWWVSKRSGTWRVYDFENLRGYLRYFLLCAEFAVGETTLEHNRLLNRVDDLQLALNAVSERNYEKAEAHLDRIGAERMPDRFEACRQLALGEILVFRKQKNKEAIEAFERSRAIDPTKPRVDFVEAVAHINLGEYDKALELLDRFIRLAGEDATVCREKAIALRGLNRPAEALEQTRRALDHQPADFSTFQTLLNSLRPGDDRSDIGRRFAQLGNSAIQFQTLAKGRIDVADWQSLEELSKEMKKIDVQSADAYFYLALCRLHENKVDEAKPLVKAGLARENVFFGRPSYTETFVQGAIRDNKTNEAYAASPDPRRAFRAIGGELQRSFRHAELRRFVARHAKAFPADPEVSLFKAQVAFVNGDYETADKLFADAQAKRADATLLEQAQPQRIETLYHLGRALTAYDEAASKDLAFNPLANLAWQDRDEGLLRKLVDRQIEFNDRHGFLPRSKFRLMLLGKKEAEAGALFKEAAPRHRDDPANLNVVNDYVFDCIDAGLPMVAYDSAPNRRAAFERIAIDLRGRGERDQLAKLIALHRKNDAGDPWLDFIEGGTFADENDWKKAAASMLSAWKKAGAAEKSRMQFRLFAIAVKGGAGLDVFEASPDKPRDFLELSRQMIQSKKLADLDKLIAAYRPLAPNDPELLMVEARAKLAAKQLNRAGETFERALASVKASNLQRIYASEFLNDAIDQDQGLEAYRLVPKSFDAFDIAATRMQMRKQTDQFDALVKERTKTKPGDPRLFRFRGDVAFQRGDFAKAELDYRAAITVSPIDLYYCKNAIELCRFKAGQALAVYTEGAGDPMTFIRIAELCVREKDAGQLKAVIAAHRKIDPDEPDLLRYEFQARLLAKDDAGVLALHAQVAKAKRKAVDEFVLSDSLVRALIHLKKFDEAQRAADEACKKRHGDRMLLVLAAAATGDVDKTIAAAEASRITPYSLRRFYEDPDLGPLLRQPAFAPFRTKHPEPPTVIEFDDYDD